MSPQKYKHSGRVTLRGILFGCLLGTIAALPIGLAYGVFSGSESGDVGLIKALFAYVGAPFIVGVIVGWSVAWGARWGKTRSAHGVAVFALLSAVVLMYVQWNAWSIGIVQMTVPGTNFSWLTPNEIWEIASAFSKDFGWIFLGIEFSGGLLRTMWVLEALAILGSAAVTAFLVMERWAFCEPCRRWTKRTYKQRKAMNVSPIDLMTTVAAGGLHNVLALPSATFSGPAYQVRLDQCRKCKRFTVLTIGTQKAGNRSIDEKLIDRLVVMPAPNARPKGHSGYSNTGHAGPGAGVGRARHPAPRPPSSSDPWP